MILAGNIRVLVVVLLHAHTIWAEADYFYRPCSKIINKNNATMSLSSGSEMSGMGSTSEYMNMCGDLTYLMTIADCINTATGLMNSSHSKQESAKAFSWKYFHYICNYYGASLEYSWKDVDHYLGTHPVNWTYAEADASGKLPFHVPSSALEPVIKPSEEYYWNRRASDVYGQALIYYIFGIMGISMLINFLARFVPSWEAFLLNLCVVRYIRRFFTMPPLFYSRTYSPLLHCHIQRGTALQLLGLTVLNYTLMGVKMAVTPNEYVYPTRYGLISSALGFRSGYFAMYKLPFVFFFAARNNFLIFLTGWSPDTFNAWHRWLARITTIDVLIHFIAYNIEYMHSGLLLEWRKAYWVVGVVATISFMIMCTQGQKQIRALAYEVFLVVHIVLALVSLITLYFHLQYTKQCFGLYWTLVALWGFDRSMRLVRIYDSGLAKAICTETSPGILKIDVKQKTKFVDEFYGCYVFIYFRDRFFFWQSHPFTVIDYDWSDQSVKLLCKPQKGLSSKLLKEVQDAETNDTVYTVPVGIEGPYGRSINLPRFENIICFAGGIGITAIYSYLRQMPHYNRYFPISVQIHWAVTGPTDFFDNEIQKWKDVGFDVHIYSKNPLPPSTSDYNHDGKIATDGSSLLPTLSAKPNFSEILYKQVDGCRGSIGVLCCGPSRMNLEMRQTAATCITRSSYYLQYFEEFYSY